MNEMNDNEQECWYYDEIGNVYCVVVHFDPRGMWVTVTHERQIITAEERHKIIADYLRANKPRRRESEEVENFEW